MKRFAHGAFLLLSSLGAHAGGAIWTAAEGFSNVNPNGEWAVGRLDSAVFSLLPVYHHGELARWDSGLPFPQSYPAAVKNLSDEPIFFGGNVPILPGQMAIHPGASPVSMRWTAPGAGEYSIAARFENHDEIGDGFVVRVLIDGSEVFTASLLSAKAFDTYADTLALAAGSTVDFTATAHTGDIIGDVSGFEATIERLTPGSCPEDIDIDGDVDFADLNLLLGNFNTSGTGLAGDVDSDGDVDFADLNRVLGLFNTAC